MAVVVKTWWEIFTVNTIGSFFLNRVKNTTMSQTMHRRLIFGELLNWHLKTSYFTNKRFSSAILLAIIAMTPTDILKKVRPWFINQTIISKKMEQLMLAMNILTREQLERIHTQQTRQDRNAQLLRELENCNDSTYRRLREVLKSTGQHHIVESLDCFDFERHAHSWTVNRQPVQGSDTQPLIHPFSLATTPFFHLQQIKCLLAQTNLLIIRKINDSSGMRNYCSF